MMNSDLLKNIRLLGCNNIYKYEKRPITTSVETQIDENSVIYHPLPVTHIQQGRYLLLDNTEYFESLRASGITEVPVQVCTQNELSVNSEKIGVIDISIDDIEKFVDQNSNCFLSDDKNTNDSQVISLKISFNDNSITYLNIRRITGTGCPDTIQKLFLYFEQKGGYFPYLENNNNTTLCRLPSYTAFIELPSFHIFDLIGAVSSGLLFPINTVTVQAEKRVFCVDFPVSILKSSKSITHKESFLRDLITYREVSRKTSSYSGHIYLLNR